jgi:hypothetical protein
LFRIFLKKKLQSGKKTKDAAKQEGSKKGRERRVHERYPVDQQHLTVLNEQDILVIKDISAKGFCSDVSHRAFDRFQIGDVYDARIRYYGEVQDIHVKVAWKREKAVGFELHKPRVEILVFFQRLLRPMQLALSLSPVEPAFMKDPKEGLQWYHGEDADLHIWHNDERELSAWQLIADKNLIEWSSVHGLKTGEAQPASLSSLVITSEAHRVRRIMDDSIDAKRIRFAADLFTALPIPEKADLLKSLDENLTS